jgi:hypothetical protein
MPWVWYGAGNVNSPRAGRKPAICDAESSGLVVRLVVDSTKPPGAETVCANTVRIEELPE